MYDRARFCMMYDDEQVCSARISPASLDFKNIDLFTGPDNGKMIFITKMGIQVLYSLNTGRTNIPVVPRP
jgi:hypothetical protein